jgi:hypothetical protein
MPLTVGGGLRTVEDMYTMLRAGADKISINSSAIATPDLIRAGAEKFGSQCIVVAIDAKRSKTSWEVYIHGGRTPTGLDAVKWAKKAGIPKGFRPSFCLTSGRNRAIKQWGNTPTPEAKMNAITMLGEHDWYFEDQKHNRYHFASRAEAETALRQSLGRKA